MPHPEPQSLLEDGSFQRFLTELGQLSPAQAALKARGRFESSRELSTLFQCYRKAEKKIPSFLKLLPALDQRSLEQCTSESIAKRKAELLSGGKTLLSISGGLGIDEWAFAEKFALIKGLDPDERLNRMVRYNWKMAELDEQILRLDLSAEAYLEQFPEARFDCIYADPDRRTGRSKSDPGQHSPDVFALMPRLLGITESVWVKFSPLLDTDWLAGQEYVQQIWCLAEKQEMKEVLVHFARHTAQSLLFGSIHLMGNAQEQVYTYRGARTSFTETEEVLDWVYIPDTAMTHSRLSFECAREMGMPCLSKSGQIFTSSEMQVSWPGRRFRYQKHFPYHRKKLQKYVEEEEVSGAIVMLRGSSLKAEDVKKLFRLRESGSDILLFTRAGRQEMVFHLKEPV